MKVINYLLIKIVICLVFCVNVKAFETWNNEVSWHRDDCSFEWKMDIKNQNDHYALVVQYKIAETIYGQDKVKTGQMDLLLKPMSNEDAEHMLSLVVAFITDLRQIPIPRRYSGSENRSDIRLLLEDEQKMEQYLLDVLALWRELKYDKLLKIANVFVKPTQIH